MYFQTARQPSPSGTNRQPPPKLAKNHGPCTIVMAIGWAVTFGVTNLMPLTQIAMTMRLHPFGRGTLIAIALTTTGFYVVPLAARALLGTGGAVSAGAVAVGCAVLAAGMWRFRATLRLSVMPGLSAVARRIHSREEVRHAT